MIIRNDSRLIRKDNIKAIIISCSASSYCSSSSIVTDTYLSSISTLTTHPIVDIDTILVPILAVSFITSTYFISSYSLTYFLDFISSVSSAYSSINSTHSTNPVCLDYSTPKSLLESI